MSISADPAAINITAAENQPWTFWRLLDTRIQPEDWMEAIRDAVGCLAGLPLDCHLETSQIVASILSEDQFGPDHWRLSRIKALYYRVVRPLLPDFLRIPLRTFLLSRQRHGFALNWPIEERYVHFQFEIVRSLLTKKQLNAIPFIHFWPEGKRFAFVLTHDIESALGQDFVHEVAALEESYGFRSSFNFVPEEYKVDGRLLEGLRQRGFEVGVHGLKHDGRLFSSRSGFERQARRINQYLKSWDAVGFRSPMTHRNPAWMQALEIEYDLSFFDTDPFEPINGGTMSIWPFQMGRFLELPYTLTQDYTLMVTLGETTPRLWLEKVAFIEKYYGMALLNAHPDYLSDPKHFKIYETFLQQMCGHGGYWHALPRDAARWWQRRAMISPKTTSNGEFMMPADEFGYIIKQIRSLAQDEFPIPNSNDVVVV